MLFLKRFYPIFIFFILFLILLWCIVYFLNSGSIKLNEEAKFSVIITIFIFGSGLFAQALGEKIKQYNKDKQLKRVIIHNLHTISEGLQFQIKNFNSIIKGLESTQSDKALLFSYAELDYFEINNVRSEDLYRVFIDFQKGKEEDKIDNLENLRKQIRFIESSRNDFIIAYEKLFNEIRNIGNKVIDTMKELGEFHDQEATKLENKEVDINNDQWFLDFSNLYGEAILALRTNNNSYTDFNKIETSIIPSFSEFFQDNIKDLRTPKVASIFNKAITFTFQRKDTIGSLVKSINFYSKKYQEAKKLIESTINIYEDKENK